MEESPVIVIPQVSTTAGGLGCVSYIMYGMCLGLGGTFWLTDRPDITFDVKLLMTALGLGMAFIFFLMMKLASRGFSVTLTPTYIQIKGKGITRQFGRDEVKAIIAYRSSVTSVNVPAAKVEQIPFMESASAGVSMDTVFVHVSTDWFSPGQVPTFDNHRNIGDKRSIFFYQPTAEVISFLTQYYSDKIVP